MFFDSEKICSRTLYFSLIIVKSLQFRRRRQITEPCKYYLVRVIVFLWCVFTLFFCFSQGENFRLNSLQGSTLQLFRPCQGTLAAMGIA